jgi:RNA polymerase sigma-70 factor (ECF subfamily)
VDSSTGRPAGERSDAELLAAHVAGDRYAFEELFHRHHRQLYRLAMITSRNPDDAADSLQDALLSAHRGAASFRRDCAVSSWLYRIVVNACLDRLRRNKSHLLTPLATTAAWSATTRPVWTPRSWSNGL